MSSLLIEIGYTEDLISNDTLRYLSMSAFDELENELDSLGSDLTIDQKILQLLEKYKENATKLKDLLLFEQELVRESRMIKPVIPEQYKI